jgi:hypothetical protein
MPAKTKYSRSTWYKKQLQQNMNTPHLGNNACSLCSDGSIPPDLNVHVTDSQTCADVHLQLALLRYNNDLCAVGQEKYGDICCPKKTQIKMKSTLGVTIGAIFIGYVLKRIITRRRNRRLGKDSDDDGNGDVLPVTRTSSQSSGSELEIPKTIYKKMADDDYDSKPRSTSRSHSRPRSRARSRAREEQRSQSRSRSSGVATVDTSSRSSSTRRSRKGTGSILSRGKSRSQSRPRSQSRSRSKSRTRERSRGQHHERPQSYIPNVMMKNNNNQYYRHEEVEVSSATGPILPTQLV